VPDAPIAGTSIAAAAIASATLTPRSRWQEDPRHVLKKFIWSRISPGDDALQAQPSQAPALLDERHPRHPGG